MSTIENENKSCVTCYF